ncbi:MAG: 2-oxoacid:acceptor oxidoreductase family protein [Chloroflexota bacterium]
MERSTVFAGFGGQGLLFAGEALARAALAQGLEVLWIPSYGPEMRGGTANCTVIVSDGPIGSPVVDHLDAAVLLNPPSLARFAPMVAHGGLLVVNDSLIEAAVDRTDVRTLRVRCTALARDAGAERLTSVVALGALIGAMGIISVETAQAALIAMVERKHPELLAGNLQAFEAGLEAVALGAYRH